MKVCNQLFGERAKDRTLHTFFYIYTFYGMKVKILEWACLYIIYCDEYHLIFVY